ncbi:MAG TPA: hypothetical protein VFC39_06345 [Acidobacteriaceae bacterium]|nr:hypothetical protein [Acidobacteriaceae bacterium]
MGPRTFRTPTALAICCLAVATAGAQVFVVGEKTATSDAVTDFTPTRLPLPSDPLTERGRRELLQNLVSEQGFAHRNLPLGAGLTLLANGNMTPSGDAYRQMLYKKGQSAAPGDRVAITAVVFQKDRIILDLNGGPYAKHRFLSHIELNDNPVAQLGPTATGCRITLVFEGGIPEISGAEVKALLDPVIDFHAKTGEEAYADTLPPKLREAVAAHEVLVGMTKQMVLAAMGAPNSKEREHVDANDENSQRYEEWIYGVVPQPLQFVRFRNDRVVRLEIAELGKPVEIRTKNQVGPAQLPENVRVIASGDAQPGEEGNRPGTAPTLRKPGEGSPNAGEMGPVVIPGDSKPATAGTPPHWLPGDPSPASL